MPAAAVIPAPIAYIKVVAVKKLVVECGVRDGCCWGAVVAFAARRVAAVVHSAHLAHWRPVLSGAGVCRLECVYSAGVTLLGCLLKHSYYCEKIRVFQAVIF